MSKLKVGITGARGVLGAITTQILKERNIESSLFTGDIRNESDIKQWLLSNKLDAIIHYAAVTATSAVQDSFLEAYKVNAGGAINLLSAIEDSGQKPWLFSASTCHVYKSKSKAISENDSIEPISLYGLTKYTAERVFVDYMEMAEFPICIGRIFSFYHKTQKKPFLYPSIKERLEKEDLTKPFFLHGASSERDFLNAEEVCSIILSLMKGRSSGIFNIASGKSTRVSDFVKSLTKKKLNIETDGNKTTLVANIKKLNKELERINSL